jgi:hypothetical protein
MAFKGVNNMAIPASKIVSVIPRLIQAGGTELEITGLFLTENPLLPFPHVYSFDSKAAVKDYFGADSAEYALAGKYFLGYDNSFRKPRRLHFARRAAAAIPAFLRGAKFMGTIASLAAITDGSLKIGLNGAAPSDVSGIDLSGAASLSDAAQTIAAALGGASVSYSSATGAFTVTSNVAGAQSAATYAEAAASGTDLSALLGLTLKAGAVLSQGSGALTGSANMDSVKAQTEGFVTFSTVYAADDAEALSLAEWASGQSSEYLYVLWSQSPLLPAQQDASSIARQIAEANCGAVAGIFGDADYAAFIMGAAASVDWGRRNGAITFAFKSQEGLAATVNDGNSADILNGKRFNFYGRYGARADDNNFIFLYNGCMFGDWRFIDPYINGIWLRNALQISLLAGIKASPRTPYTDGGYTLIRAWCSGPIERALLNGAIEPGVNLSNSQKAELFLEAGEDISTDLYTKGYYLQVLDPAAVVRVNRESPAINLWYTYGGSIHKLDVAATAML